MNENNKQLQIENNIKTQVNKNYQNNINSKTNINNINTPRSKGKIFQRFSISELNLYHEMPLNLLDFDKIEKLNFTKTKEETIKNFALNEIEKSKDFKVLNPILLYYYLEKFPCFLNYLKLIELHYKLILKVFEYSKYLIISKGSFIYKQKEKLDNFYLLVSGSIKLLSFEEEIELEKNKKKITSMINKNNNDKNKSNITGNDSNDLKKKLFETNDNNCFNNKSISNKDKIIKEGNFFGDTFLINKSKTNNSTLALEDCILLAIPEEVFKKYFELHISKCETNIKANILSKIKTFDKLNYDNYLLFSQYFKDIKREYLFKNQILIKENDLANAFYILYKGKCLVKKGSTDLLILNEGSFLGLESLYQKKYLTEILSFSEDTVLFKFSIDKYDIQVIKDLQKEFNDYYKKQIKIFNDNIQKKKNLLLNLNTIYQNIKTRQFELNMKACKRENNLNISNKILEKIKEREEMNKKLKKSMFKFKLSFTKNQNNIINSGQNSERNERFKNLSKFIKKNNLIKFKHKERHNFQTINSAIHLNYLKRLYNNKLIKSSNNSNFGSIPNCNSNSIPLTNKYLRKNLTNLSGLFSKVPQSETINNNISINRSNNFFSTSQKKKYISELPLIFNGRLHKKILKKNSIENSYNNNSFNNNSNSQNSNIYNNQNTNSDKSKNSSISIINDSKSLNNESIKNDNKFEGLTLKVLDKNSEQLKIKDNNKFNTEGNNNDRLSEPSILERRLNRKNKMLKLTLNQKVMYTLLEWENATKICDNKLNYNTEKFDIIKRKKGKPLLLVPKSGIK